MFDLTKKPEPKPKQAPKPVPKPAIKEPETLFKLPKGKLVMPPYPIQSDPDRPVTEPEPQMSYQPRFEEPFTPEIRKDLHKFFHDKMKDVSGKTIEDRLRNLQKDKEFMTKFNELTDEQKRNVTTIVLQESTANPKQVAKGGATGLFQEKSKSKPDYAKASLALPGIGKRADLTSAVKALVFQKENRGLGNLTAADYVKHQQGEPGWQRHKIIQDAQPGESIKLHRLASNKERSNKDYPANKNQMSVSDVDDYLKAMHDNVKDSLRPYYKEKITELRRAFPGNRSSINASKINSKLFEDIKELGKLWETYTTLSISATGMSPTIGSVKEEPTPQQPTREQRMRQEAAKRIKGRETKAPTKKPIRANRRR